MFLRVNTFVGFVLVHVGFSASRVPAEGALGLNVAPEDGDEEEERKRKRMQEEELNVQKRVRGEDKERLRRQRQEEEGEEESKDCARVQYPPFSRIAVANSPYSDPRSPQRQSIRKQTFKRYALDW
jgi:hypothetical protein